MSDRHTTCARACLILFLGFLPLAAYGADPAGPGQANLTYESGPAVLGIITPQKALTGGKSFAFSAGQGTIQVAGTSFLVGGLRSPTSAVIGADMNFSGTIDRNEYQPLPADGNAAFEFALAGPSGSGRYAILLTDLRVYAQSSSTGASYVAGKCVVGFCYKGTVNGTAVRIFDDNLDGKITQDGKDAVAIGGSPAIPLAKVHQIGASHCQIEVAQDGSSIKFTRLTDLKLGVVELPIKSPALRCLALVGDGGKCYDLVASGKTGIPAGDYKLRFGLLMAGKDMVSIEPSKSSLTYPIAADSINTLRMGPPVTLDFPVSYVDGRITVSPGITIVGAGGEVYRADSPTRSPPPVVAFLNGSTTLSSTSMSYG